MLEGKAIERHIFWLLSLGTLLFGALVLLILNGYIAARLQRLSANLRLIGDDGAVRRLLVEGNDGSPRWPSTAIECSIIWTACVSASSTAKPARNCSTAPHSSGQERSAERRGSGQAARHINEAICSGTGAARGQCLVQCRRQAEHVLPGSVLLPKLHHQQGFHLPYALIRGATGLKPEHEPCLILREPYDLTRFGAMLAQLGLEGLSGTILMAPQAGG